MSDELSERIREAIRASGVSHSELARTVNIPQPTITRFMNGRDMKLSNASILVKYLGLELTPAGKPKKRP